MTTRLPDRRGAAALAWWRAMQPMTEGQGRTSNPMADAGALAQLRRADMTAAMGHRATHALLVKLEVPDRYMARSLPRVALVAAVLAQCRGHREGTPLVSVLSPAIAERMGGGDPTLKPLRFERLLRAEEPEERLTALRRAIRLAHPRPFDLARLAADLLAEGDGWRTRWIMDYHHGPSLAAGPDDTTPPEETAA